MTQPRTVDGDRRLRRDLACGRVVRHRRGATRSRICSRATPGGGSSAHYERVLDTPDDPRARGAMLLGAHQAGIAIEQSMLGAAHACANPLTARYGTTHGDRDRGDAAARRAVERGGSSAIGMRSCCASSGADAGGDAGGALAAKLDALARAAGLPRTLQELGVERGALRRRSRPMPRRSGPAPSIPRRSMPQRPSSCTSGRAERRARRARRALLSLFFSAVSAGSAFQ